MEKEIEGFLVLDFKDINDDFKCNICCGLLIRTFKSKKILQCVNGHRHCLDCWKRNIKNECYVCRYNYIDTSFLSNNSYLFEQISKSLEVKCVNKSKLGINGNTIEGCKEVLQIGSMETHLKKCNYQLVDCHNNSLLCGEILQKDVESHEVECLFKVIKCNQCGIGIVKKYMSQHLDTECSETVKKCFSCQALIKNIFQKDHIEKHCPEYLINCVFNTNTPQSIPNTGIVNSCTCTPFKRKDSTLHYITNHNLNNDLITNLVQVINNLGELHIKNKNNQQIVASTTSNANVPKTTSTSTDNTTATTTTNAPRTTTTTEANNDSVPNVPRVVPPNATRLTTIPITTLSRAIITTTTTIRTRPQN